LNWPVQGSIQSMFEFLFKYPSAVFAKGEFALLGAWPRWMLAALILAVMALLAWRIRSRLPEAAPNLRGWRAVTIWLMQSALLALLLLLLWQPAISVAELKPQQNIIAVIMDDSRSMSIADEGAPRQVRAVEALDNGVLAELRKKFQVRLYKMDRGLSAVSDFKQLQASAAVTHIGDGLKQLSDETSDLPLGAVVLLSDGGENSGGLDRNAISALRNRRIPVHTVGFGKEHMGHDVEIGDATVAPRALADSRLAATVNFHQYGYAGHKAMLRVRDGDKVLAAREITLGADGALQTELIPFSAGTAGPKALQFSIDALDGEENRFNNAVTRLVKVESDERRVLYVEGEPRWEFKFIRRAEDDDRIVKIVSMLRTTENKLYWQGWQGIETPQSMAAGFPSTAEALFKYHAIILGSVEASYFTAAQQDLIKQFVDRRGGGLLMLGGGRFALSEGGWGASPVAETLPVTLPTGKGTFQRDPATAVLTSAGADSTITRLAEDPAQNAEKWKKLPYLMNYQDPGKAKPGAATLLDMTVNNRTMPLLITQNYGRGRTSVLATGGTWRWQMSMPVEDQSHEMFWRQLLRWLVTDSPGQITTSVPNPMLFDDGRIQISADVREKDYTPAADATVVAHILGPEGTASEVEMAPDPNTPGVFHADWNAEKSGRYVAQITAKRGNEELGQDELDFQRMDGVAENFHTEQNRPLLESLASQTGGRYWRPQDLSKLPSEISYSEAGITIRDTKELWNMPAVFLVLLLLCGGEWLLRRKWGIV
jgi:uncharacterized membrane protein